MEKKMAQMFNQNSINRMFIQLIAVLFSLAALEQSISAQDVKGGGGQRVSLSSSSSLADLGVSEISSKGGSQGVSRFRDAITSFQQRQFVQQQQEEQKPEPILNQNINQVNLSQKSITSIEPPKFIEQQQQQQVQTNLNIESQINSNYINEQQQQQQQQQLQQTSQSSADAEPIGTIFGSIKGTPGVDFPAYTSIPNTKFSCSDVPFTPGMYADELTQCQAYHLCHHGRRESFLCGIGTVFNQAILNCDYWHSVECSKSSKYYQLNADFGQSAAEPQWNNNGKTSVVQQQQQQQQLQQTTPSKTQNFIGGDRRQVVSAISDSQQLSWAPQAETKSTINQQQQLIKTIHQDTISPQAVPISSFAVKSADNRRQQQMTSTSVFGDKISYGGGGKTNLVSREQVNQQQQQQRQALVSPGRRLAALYNSRPQFGGSQMASESSTRMEVTKSDAPVVDYPAELMSNQSVSARNELVQKQQQYANNITTVGSPVLMVVAGTRPPYASQSVSLSIKTSNKQAANKQQQQSNQLFASSGSGSKGGASIKGAKGSPRTNNLNDADEVWRPYFKSKVSASSTQAPPYQLATIRPTNLITKSEQLPLTIGLANQAPSFLRATSSPPPPSTAPPKSKPPPPSPVDDATPTSEAPQLGPASSTPTASDENNNQDATQATTTATTATTTTTQSSLDKSSDIGGGGGGGGDSSTTEPSENATDENSSLSSQQLPTTTPATTMTTTSTTTTTTPPSSLATDQSTGTTTTLAPDTTITTESEPTTPTPTTPSPSTTSEAPEVGAGGRQAEGSRATGAGAAAERKRKKKRRGSPSVVEREATGGPARTRPASMSSVEYAADG